MIRTLAVRNRQRTRPVNTRLLRRLALWAVQEHWGHAEFELGIHLIGAREMARLNESFLRHSGSTDVITFDLRDEAAPDSRVHPAPAAGPACHGEIFISVDDAVRQARQFRTTWQSELVRYLLHGLLHLHGFDDGSSADRRRMKRQENRVLRLAARAFVLRSLGLPEARPTAPS